MELDATLLAVQLGNRTLFFHFRYHFATDELPTNGTVGYFLCVNNSETQ